MTQFRKKISTTKALLLASLIGGLLLFTAQPALAERLESGSYVIQFGNFNITSGEKNSTSYNVTDTVGQDAAGLFSGSSYQVGSGFQYIYQIGRFSFQVSRVAVDLGTLIIGTHNTGSHNLVVSTRGGYGYIVYAFELNPLRRSDHSTFIPDTTCDAGTCSQTAAGVWTNQSIAGFGFNMTGHDIPGDFVNSTYFRQFANNEASEAMQTVMSSANEATNRTSTVTMKAGISSSQAAGDYQTGIVYVAVPGY
jgi:hypothetical protein